MCVYIYILKRAVYNALVLCYLLRLYVDLSPFGFSSLSFLNSIATQTLLSFLRAIYGVHVWGNLCFQEQLILDLCVSDTAYWIA